MNEFVINVAPDPSTIININNLDDAVSLNIGQNQTNSITIEDDVDNVLLNPSVFYNGINIVYLSGVSGELLHNTFGDLQGGTTGQYYHLSSGQYFNLTTGAVVRPNETGTFYTSNNPSGFITGISNLVFTTGSQTISGEKTFLSRPTVNSVGVLLIGEAATQGYVTGISGELQTQITTLNNQTGSYYPKTNPSGYITGVNLSGYVTGDVVRPNETGNFITTGQTGQFYAASNPSGFITGVNLSAYVTGDVVRPSDTGSFITTSQTGVFYPTSNPSGFVTGSVVRPSDTGSFITTGQTGAFYPVTNPSGYITGVDLSSYVTGQVVRPSETGNFITTSQTGAFYASSNPSGFITGVDLSGYVTGEVVRPSETGVFYTIGNPSGFIPTGEADLRFVNVTGNETISGEKTFINSVDLRSGVGITGIINFNREQQASLLDGQVAWHPDYGTVQIGMDGGDVINPIGFKTFYRVKATSTIRKGKVVMAAGSVGNSEYILAREAQGIGASGELIMGISAEEISTNNFGDVVAFGAIRGVNTSSFPEESILYYDPASTGGLTNQLPQAPNAKVIVGFVTSQANNGVVFTRVTAGSQLGQTDSNVLFSGAVNGDSIFYNSGIWVNRQIQTGDISGINNYYLASNPSGYITGVNLSACVTGDVVRPSDTGIFYTTDNPSGFITGIADLVFTTGNQTISGEKNFELLPESLVVGISIFI